MFDVIGNFKLIINKKPFTAILNFVPAVAEFEPLNLESSVDCFTYCANVA
jgi:hypothetical protein